MIPNHLRHQARSGPAYGGRHSSGKTVRGVVLRVYDPDSPQRRAPLIRPPGYVCDVLVYEVGMQGLLREVPIATGAGGLNDHEIWKPRAASLDLAAGVLTVSTEGLPGYTSKASDMDGDHVLVTFINNDIQKPIIVGQVPHPRNRRKPSITDTTTYKSRKFVRGVSWGVTDGGDLQLDATLASDGSISPDGTELVSPTAGNIDVVVGAARRVAVSLAAATSTTREPPVLGTSYLTSWKTLLTAWSTEATASQAAHTASAAAHTAYAAHFTGLADPVTAAAATAAATAETAAATNLGTLVTQIATLIGMIDTSLSAGKPFLAVTLEVD